MDTATIPQLIAALDPEQLRAHLDDLDRQARATRVLLRAALARRRESDRRGDHHSPEEEVARA
jgi:hypothetical protein